MNTLAYSCRSYLGWGGDSILPHFKFLDKDNLDILSMTTSDQYKKKFLEYGINITNKNIFGEAYETFKSYPSWSDVYADLDVSLLSEYSRFVLIGGVDLWRSNLTRPGKRVNKFPHDSGQLKFVSVGKHLINLLALLKASNTFDIPLHEVAFDPNEMSLDLVHSDFAPKKYSLYHGYDVSQYKMNRLDTLQYFYQSKSHSLFDDDDKSIDFVFGYNVLENNDRSKYISDIQEISSKFQKSEIYTKNHYTGENTLLPKNAYLNKIKEARYTYMLPAYDSTCFSIYRFIESINNDCLPLLHSDVFVDDVERSFDVALADLKCFPLSESNRVEKLDYLKHKMLKFQNDLRKD